MTVSYQTRLEEVQAAITKILNNAQSVSVAGRDYEYGDLKTLHDMEMQLRLLADRESNGGIKVRGVTPV